jgi:type VI secretion system protein ImpF
MSGLPYVRKSVLNYGVVDLSNFTSADVTSSDLPKRLAEAILNCEPRFIPETLEVKLRKDFDDVQQRLTFDIYAEMACKPVDIPLEFSAEIDVGSGKMKFSNLSGS